MMNKCKTWIRKFIWKAIPLFIVMLSSTLLISCYPKSMENSSIKATEELRNAIKMPLDLYTPMMSSVPGLPVEVEFLDSWKESSYDVVVTCKNGVLLSWNPPDYVVKEQGKSFKLYSSSTFYWSPYRNQRILSEDMLTFTLYTGSKQIGQIEIEINANDQGFYHGMMK